MTNKRVYERVFTRAQVKQMLIQAGKTDSFGNAVDFTYGLDGTIRDIFEFTAEQQWGFRNAIAGSDIYVSQFPWHWHGDIKFSYADPLDGLADFFSALKNIAWHVDHDDAGTDFADHVLIAKTKIEHATLTLENNQISPDMEFIGYGTDFENGDKSYWISRDSNRQYILPIGPEKTPHVTVIQMVETGMTGDRYHQWYDLFTIEPEQLRGGREILAVNREQTVMIVRQPAGGDTGKISLLACTSETLVSVDNYDDSRPRTERWTLDERYGMPNIGVEFFPENDSFSSIRLSIEARQAFGEDGNYDENSDFFIEADVSWYSTGADIEKAKRFLASYQNAIDTRENFEDNNLIGLAIAWQRARMAARAERKAVAETNS